MTAKIYPQEMTPELAEVLGMMVFQSGPIAHAFRDAGHAIPNKCEAEQAFVLHWLIGLALEHGEDWQKRAGETLDGLRPRTEGGDDAR